MPKELIKMELGILPFAILGGLILITIVVLKGIREIIRHLIIFPIISKNIPYGYLRKGDKIVLNDTFYTSCKFLGFGYKDGTAIRIQRMYQSKKSGDPYLMPLTDFESECVCIFNFMGNKWINLSYINRERKELKHFYLRGMGEYGKIPRKEYKL